MQTITEISRWIRDYGHDPRHIQHLSSVPFDWHQLWTALNTIDDVELAIHSYLEGEFPAGPGEQYLRLYGVFQALFVQQDAMRHFIEIIRPGTPFVLADVLRDVREARNASVGHPTEVQRKGEVSAHGISRSTIGRDGFLLMSFSDKGGSSFTNVPVLELIAKQRKEVVRVLLEVVKQLKADDEEHKGKFRGRSLKDCFRLVTYAFEKISANLRGKDLLGAWGAGELQSSLTMFEKMLNERGLTIETYDSIKYYYAEIEYPLAELQKFFAKQASDIASAKAAIVYANALRGWFSELMDIAQEIDEEYEKSETS
jgi:hypothetical protein